MAADTLDRLLDDLLGERELVLAGAADAVDLAPFAGKPADFIVEVLRQPLLAWQRDAADEMIEHRGGCHCWVTCNGAGKSYLLACLLLYIAAVEGGVAVFFSCTERQTRSGLLPTLRRLVEIAGLATTVFGYGCAFTNGGRVVLASQGDISSMQGFHDERLLIAADEAQSLTDDMLDASLSCVTGPRNVLVLAGNPLAPGTAFHKVASSGADLWHQVVVAAPDILSDPAAPTVGGGLVDATFVARQRQTWGEESSRFQSRVHARFPAQPSDAMYPQGAVQEAFARPREPVGPRTVPVYRLGVDVAGSEGGDETCVVIARGRVVDEILTWREADQMRNCGRVIDVLDHLGVRPGDALDREAAIYGSAFAGLLQTQPGDPDARRETFPRATIVVDAIGIGAGLDSRLRERGYTTIGFNASRHCEDDDNRLRYQNLRAQMFDTLRDLLVRGELALPFDELLQEEFWTCRGFTNSSGRFQIISKREWRELLQPRRSPDRLDAVALAVAAPIGLQLDAWLGSRWAAM